jgi:microcompartment protein CcmL/EutN
MTRNQNAQFLSERPDNAVGIIEFTSIAKGIEAADTMLKTSDIRLLASRTICPGKHMSLISGDTAAVYSAIEAAEALAEREVVDHFVIPNLHEQVIPALEGMPLPGEMKALGIIESFSVASLVEAADTAAKTADVHLLEVRLAMAIGGKGFVTLTGDVTAVRSAVEAGAAKVGEKGLLVNKVVIANPRPEIVRDLI